MAESDLDTLSEQGRLPEDYTSATGFELMVNGGYLLWFDEGPFGSSGGPSVQLSLGARYPWPLSFGVELLGLSADWSTPDTEIILSVHPAVYLRAHSQPRRKQGALDIWGGAAIAPYAMTGVGFEGDPSDSERAAQAGLGPSQRAILQELGVGETATLQWIAIPLQLGATFFITRGFGIDISLSYTFWLPQELCFHDDSDDEACVEDGLETNHSLFIGGGLSFLP